MTEIAALILEPGDILSGSRVVESVRVADSGNIVAHFVKPEGAAFWFDVFEPDEILEVDGPGRT